MIMVVDPMGDKQIDDGNTVIEISQVPAEC
jgi:hypothetical protein